MRSSDASAEIRVAVLGDWVPPQLASVLALQRADEPGSAAELIGCTTTEQAEGPPDACFDLALSTTPQQWSGWECEPLWHDTLAVAVAKRSHLLAYREVPCQELLKQSLIYTQSTGDEPWRSTARALLGYVPHEREQTARSFDIAMTLVAAGYGVFIAPAARLIGHLHRGIALRPLEDRPTIVVTYLLRPCTSLTAPQARFIQRARVTL
ncbi:MULTISPECIES: LysR substrate-binding domain-containing protein [Comamonadaceae]|uniref:LysR substrate-binding domain-containing protein n=1 Tax=Comamonadaceae TaxID=80864 RepID=UPI00056E767C|nr:LysR substrate-binding domain-containing protein [Xenophilus azovorans]MBI2747987.1 LysR family transcriptional regulator [Burkholderiales bacterium]